MHFKQKQKFYYLSPFKLLIIEEHFGSGFPFSDHFHYVTAWEYEQVCLVRKPKSLNDIAVNIKMHFGLQITKSLIIGSQILKNESQTQIELTVALFIKDVLRNRLLEAMET